MKCDEGKPGCNRCRAIGLGCGGYKSQSTIVKKVIQKTLLPRVHPPKPPSTHHFEPSPSRRNQSSKDLWDTQTAIASEICRTFGLTAGLPGSRAQISPPPHLRDSHSVILFRQPSTSFFETEDEHRYFRFFSDRTVANIAGCYNPTLWNQSVLQACESESAILHAAIAIGALDLSFKTNRSLLNQESPYQQDSVGMHYRYSLLQYNKAIKEIQETVWKKQDLRTTLLASIMIIAFEIYHGNLDSALDQIKSSVQLLEEWTAPYARTNETSTLSPSQQTVEDDLVHAFYRLEIEGMVYIDKIPVESHISRKDDREAAVYNMPHEFQNISDAQLYGKLVMRRLIHFCMSAWTYDKDIHNAPNMNIYFLDRVRCRAVPKSLIDMDKHGEEMDRWYGAFKPFLKRATSSKDRRACFSALALQAHYICSRVCMGCVFRSSELFFDAATSDFAKILSLTKQLLAARDDSFFVFDSQVLIALEVVARKCRNYELRHEAIRMLFSIRRREGFMDSIVAAKTCAWLADIEEEGMVDGFIPEEARAHTVHSEVEQGHLRVWCEVGGKSGELVVRETIIKERLYL